MKRALVERNIVVVLFILVLVVFSFAERDTKKLVNYYNTRNTTEIDTPKTLITATEIEQPQPANTNTTKN